MIVISRFDAVVIGNGPAGLEAALNLKIRNKNFLIFGHEAVSKKLLLAPVIENYLGFPGISGMELAAKFSAHLDKMGIALTNEQVNSVYPMDGYFALSTSQNVYESTTVVIASGVRSGGVFPGEERLLGRGVGYCATCDAPLYKGKTVAVLGYGDGAVREANFIAEIAAKVYYLAMSPHKAPLDAAVSVMNAKVKGIAGDTSVTGLLLEDRTLAVDGVFILRESLSPTTLLPGIGMRGDYIEVDCDMRTTIPGCFAAGDCTGKPHQFMRAAGQGQTAALSAAAYIDNQKK